MNFPVNGRRSSKAATFLVTLLDGSRREIRHETEDPKKLIEFAYMWGDLMELSVFPVLEDQELSEALQSAMKKTRSARQ